jgi:hypothetical protein
MFEIDSKTYRWFLAAKLLTPPNVKQLSSTTFEVRDPLPAQFENGIKISHMVIEIYRKVGLPIPDTLNHLKLSNGIAAHLYNWNIINDVHRDCSLGIEESQFLNRYINQKSNYQW